MFGEKRYLDMFAELYLSTMRHLQVGIQEAAGSVLQHRACIICTLYGLQMARFMQWRSLVVFQAALRKIARKHQLHPGCSRTTLPPCAK